MISEVWHIPPWDQDRLRVSDLAAMVDELERRNREAQQAQKARGSG